MAMPMSTTELTEGIGFVAAACTTMAFVPQLIKIRKQGGRDLSYLMLFIYLFGLALWLVYGIRLHAPAIIAANLIGIALVGTALALKGSMELPKPLPPIVFEDAPILDNPLELAPAYPEALERKKLQTAAHSAAG
jgi:MtN3 and saliva related transmembrane protein